MSDAQRSLFRELGQSPGGDFVYNAFTGRWEPKRNRAPASERTGFVFDDELQLYVRPMAGGGFELALDSDGRQTFSAQDVLQSDPQRARRLMAIFEQRARFEGAGGPNTVMAQQFGVRSRGL